MAVTCRRLCLVSAMLAGLTLAAGPVLAQVSGEPPLSQTDNSLVLDALGHSFSLPFPDWLTDAEKPLDAAAPMIETHYVSSDTQVLLEIYPKGQTPGLWTTLYGARISLEASRPLSDYRSAIMLGYSQNCKPELTGFFQFGADDGDILAPLGFVCGAYRETLKGYAGQGEVMVMSFRQSEKGVAIVYQEWRGAAFDPASPATWPVATATVEAQAEQLQSQAKLALAD